MRSQDVGQGERGVLGQPDTIAAMHDPEFESGRGAVAPAGDGLLDRLRISAPIEHFAVLGDEDVDDIVRGAGGAGAAISVMDQAELDRNARPVVHNGRGGSGYVIHRFS